MSTALEKISGQGGFYLITGTATWTGYAESIVVNEDAVIAELEISSVDVLSTKGLSAKTVKAGMYLPTDPGKQITKIKLTSGSVIVYF
jgi:hypothetical protein